MSPTVVSLFHYLPSPPSAPAIGVVSVAMAVAYIAAVVELSLACLFSKLRFVVELQYQDVNTINKETSLCPGC
jgi:hypothetical protein